MENNTTTTEATQSSNKKYWGKINLNAIKDAIDAGSIPFKGAKGTYLDVQVWVNEEPDQFGNSLAIQVYNKETSHTTYLGNLKLSQYTQVDNVDFDDLLENTPVQETETVEAPIVEEAVSTDAPF